MPQATFAKDFDYRTKPGSAASSIVAYKKGMSLSIPQAHLDAASEAGALEGVAAAKQETADKSAAAK
jgi:hypothetical protein